MTSPTNHTPAELLRVSLITAGLGTDPAATGAWPVYVASMPEAPDNAVCVYDTGGTSERRLMRTGHRTDHPGVQIKVRGTEWRATYVRIQAILAHVDVIQKEAVDVGDDRYTIHAVTRRGAALALGPQNDKRHRYAFTLNGICTVTLNAP